MRDGTSACWRHTLASFLAIRARCSMLSMLCVARNEMGARLKTCRQMGCLFYTVEGCNILTSATSSSPQLTMAVLELTCTFMSCDCSSCAFSSACRNP